MATDHLHTASVLPWPNGMPFTLAQFIAVAERRLMEAHETLGATGETDTAHTDRPVEPCL